MSIQAYLINCLTNLHVGVGGNNYDIVDNAVQRDVTTGHPTIFSSSLKGALREFCKHQGLSNDDIKYIFGPDGDTESDIGHYKFLPADLLSFPVRAMDRPYYNATSKNLVHHINLVAKAFRKNGEKKEADLIDISKIKGANKGKPKTSEPGKQLEDYTSVKGNNLENKWIGKNIAVFHTEDLQHITHGLPVIARNQLDNGQSKNLWYEEIVPKATRFVFFVNEVDKDTERQKRFENCITSSPVQIGANGSIGYGYCRISKIN